MKQIVAGQVGDLGIGYEVKIEEGALKVSAVADFGVLIAKGEQMLPAGALQPFEVMILEMVKQAVKAI